MKNLKAKLPKLDEEATRIAVEEQLERYLFYKLTDYNHERKEASVTASYELRESQRTNETSDSTASVALYNVAKEEERSRHIFKIDRAVSRLNKKQRQIINMRYLTEFGVYDQDTYNDLNISAPTYRKIRNEAFYMLAFILGVYVEAEAKENN